MGAFPATAFRPPLVLILASLTPHSSGAIQQSSGWALSLDQLRALVRRLTNGTGAVTLDFPHRRILNQSVPGLGSVTVDVDHVRVEGVEQPSLLRRHRS